MLSRKKPWSALVGSKVELLKSRIAILPPEHYTRSACENEYRARGSAGRAAGRGHAAEPRSRGARTGLEHAQQLREALRDVRDVPQAVSARRSSELGVRKRERQSVPFAPVHAASVAWGERRLAVRGDCGGVRGSTGECGRGWVGGAALSG